MSASGWGRGGLRRAGKRALAAVLLAILMFAAAAAARGHSRSSVVQAGNSWSQASFLVDGLSDASS